VVVGSGVVQWLASAQVGLPDWSWTLLVSPIGAAAQALADGLVGQTLDGRHVRRARHAACHHDAVAGVRSCWTFVQCQHVCAFAGLGWRGAGCRCLVHVVDLVAWRCHGRRALHAPDARGVWPACGVVAAAAAHGCIANGAGAGSGFGGFCADSGLRPTCVATAL
jgi:hypothetical protein